MDFEKLIQEDRANNLSIHFDGTTLDYIKGIVQVDSSVSDLAHKRIYDLITSKGFETIKTDEDPKLRRIYGNDTLKVYNFFKDDFFGIEKTLMKIVRYFHSASMAGEEARQVLYLVGPVGAGKSSIMESLKHVLETSAPVYHLEGCPMHEDPLHLIPKHLRPQFEELLGVKIEGDLCPVCRYRLNNEFKDEDGKVEWEKFPVTTSYFSIANRMGVGVVPPVDPNNQDTSVLVGQVDISKIDLYPEHDPRVLSMNGAFNVGNRGIVEFIEVFKNETEYLHTMITATQEKSVPSPGKGPMVYFDGVILAHCFSEDTELLTIDGWKTYDKINIGDKLATFNESTREIEYQANTNKYVYPVSGDIMHFKSHSIDHLMTTDHNLILEGYKKFERQKANEKINKGTKWIVSGYNEKPDYVGYTDNEIMLITQVITDGSLQGSRIRFHLKKQRKIARLSELLENMAIDYKITDHNDGTFSISFENPNNQMYNKKVPTDFKQLSPRQFKVFLVEYGNTDGTVIRVEDQLVKTISVSTNVESIADYIQEMGVISGCKTTKVPCEKEGYSDVYFMNIQLYKTGMKTDDTKIEMIHYTGNVFCFSTPNKTLVSRRNGKVVITGNSNEHEWNKFKADHTNEAILDRIVKIEVPYCMDLDAEEKIYSKILKKSQFKAHIAPHTLKMASMFAILTRLAKSNKVDPIIKLKIYNGEEIIERGSTRKYDINELRDEVSTAREGMSGISTRFIMKALDNALSEQEHDCINPIAIMESMVKAVKELPLPEDLKNVYLNFIRKDIKDEYDKLLEKEITKAFIHGYKEQAVALFNNYLDHSEAYVNKTKIKDRNTGEELEPDEKFLRSIEEQIGISDTSAKGFRSDVTAYMFATLRAGGTINYESYEPLREAIEKKLTTSVRELSRVITLSKVRDKDQNEKYDAMIEQMKANGYCDHCCNVILKYGANNLWKDK